MGETVQAKKPVRRSTAQAIGTCSCGKVAIEIDMPAFWAWHDHSRATQRAQGCAYATYIGVWKSRMRITKGAKSVVRYEDAKARTIRSFCSHCGAPLIYDRGSKMVDLPRALFDGRTGREAIYHRYLQEAPDWAYRQEPLKPLTGYPGVLVSRSKRKKPLAPEFF